MNLFHVMAVKGKNQNCHLLFLEIIYKRFTVVLNYFGKWDAWFTTIEKWNTTRNVTLFKFAKTKQSQFAAFLWIITFHNFIINFSWTSLSAEGERRNEVNPIWSTNPWQGQTITPGTSCPTLCEKCVGSLTSPANQCREDAGDGA